MRTHPSLARERRGEQNPRVQAVELGPGARQPQGIQTRPSDHFAHPQLKRGPKSEEKRKRHAGSFLLILKLWFGYGTELVGLGGLFGVDSGIRGGIARVGF